MPVREHGTGVARHRPRPESRWLRPGLPREFRSASALPSPSSPFARVPQAPDVTAGERCTREAVPAETSLIPLDPALRPERALLPSPPPPSSPVAVLRTQQSQRGSGDDRAGVFTTGRDLCRACETRHFDRRVAAFEGAVAELSRIRSGPSNRRGPWRGRQAWVPAVCCGRFGTSACGCAGEEADRRPPRATTRNGMDRLRRPHLAS